MNRTFSLYKIFNEDERPFKEDEYSWFKFGDKYYAEKFAKQLFNGFIEQFEEIVLSNPEIIILPSPYLSIPTASNFLCYFFKKELNKFLFNNNRKACTESKIYRNQTYVTDYGNLDFEERVALISNDTYYLDRCFIDNKLCIFVDDIKITGSHEQTVNKILDKNNVNGEFIFIYYAELVNKSIHPKVENFYNYYAVKGVKDVINIINKDTFQFNTRVIKYILSLKTDQFEYLLNKISIEKVKDLFHLSISNNYHQITDYQNNIKTIKIV